MRFEKQWKMLKVQVLLQPMWGDWNGIPDFWVQPIPHWGNFWSELLDGGTLCLCLSIHLCHSICQINKCFNSYFEESFHLFERQSQREQEWGRDLPPSGSLREWLQWQGLARQSQEAGGFCFVFVCLFSCCLKMLTCVHKAKHWCHLPLLCQAQNQGTGLELEQLKPELVPI